MTDHEKQFNTEFRDQEIMKLPEIVIEPRWGCTFYFILQELLKKKDLSFLDPKLENETNQNILDKFEKMVKKADEETLFYLSILYDEPEKKDEILNIIKTFKAHIQISNEFIEDYLNLLKDFENKNSYIREFLKKYFEKDREKGEELLSPFREKINSAIKFFLPKANTTRIKRIIILQAGSLIEEQEGRGIDLGYEIIVVSHGENINTLLHEFLHGIINPITNKLDLNKEQCDLIVKLVSQKQKVEQAYGVRAESLLNEVLIRVYIINILNKKIFLDFEEFCKRVQEMNEEDFQNILKEVQTDIQVKQLFDELGIKNLSDLENNKLKLEGLFNLIVKDELRERVYNLYKQFEEEKKKNINITFEDFFLGNFERLVISP